jgi:hypothetical protein
MSDAPSAPDRPDLRSRLADLLGLSGRESAAALVGASLETLQRQTRAQLLVWGRRLGLTGLHRLTKEALVERFHAALEALGVAEGRAESAATEPVDPVHKFDLGRSPEPAPMPRHIPWGYGQERVTAMVVDPGRLYVYWEATDEAIERARAGLGPGGPGAWLNLRVYDVTGRLFDGTNAHGYFDQRVERSDRQWFFDIEKPGSTACVELGLKSLEGYFVRIVRSGRADFPRREPAPAGSVEWLTVRTASGEIAPPVVAERSSTTADTRAPAGGPAWNVLRAEEPIVPGEAFVRPWEWGESFHSEWTEGVRRLQWRGPVVRTSWEAGPFSYPVESPVYVEERHGGTVTVTTRSGRTHVVYGPWQIVIRGLGAWAERRVVATWELACSWVAGATTQRSAARGTAGAPGSSEHLAGASELRLGGASEVYVIGASEIRYLGASETLYGGASERAYGGASEWSIPRR